MERHIELANFSTGNKCVWNKMREEILIYVYI